MNTNYLHRRRILIAETIMRGAGAVVENWNDPRRSRHYLRKLKRSPIDLLPKVDYKPMRQIHLSSKHLPGGPIDPDWTPLRREDGYYAGFLARRINWKRIERRGRLNHQKDYPLHRMVVQPEFAAALKKCLKLGVNNGI